MYQRNLKDSSLRDIHKILARLKIHILNTITSITPDGDYWTMMRALCALPPYVDRKITRALIRLEGLMDTETNNSSTDVLENESRDADRNSNDEISCNSNLVTSCDHDQNSHTNLTYERNENFDQGIVRDGKVESDLMNDQEVVAEEESRQNGPELDSEKQVPTQIDDDYGLYDFNEEKENFISYDNSIKQQKMNLSHNNNVHTSYRLSCSDLLLNMSMHTNSTTNGTISFSNFMGSCQPNLATSEDLTSLNDSWRQDRERISWLNHDTKTLTSSHKRKHHEDDT